MFRSLYFKIVLILLVFILAVMGVISVVLLSGVSSFYTEQFTERMEESFSPTSLLYAELMDALASEDYAEEQKSILNSYSSILGIDRYRNYYVLSMEGTMLSGSDAELGSTLQITPNMLTAMSGKTENRPSGSGGYADFAVYLHSGEKACIIYVKDSLEEMNQLSSRIFSIILLALGIGIAIAVLLSFFLAKAITSPLQSLTVGAQLIASGEFSHEIDVHSHDEIGILSDTFNNMKEVLKNTLLEIDGEKTKLETVLSCISDAIVAFSEKGKVLHINEKASALFGYAQLQILTMENFFEKFDIPLERREKGIVLTAKKALSERLEDGTLIFRDKVYNDRVFDVSLGRIQYLSENVRHVGLIAVIHDVTGRFELDRSRREFVANVSHELRTPLTSIKGACETIRDNPDMDDDTRDFFLDMALNESDRMTRIVSDLLVLSRLDNKKTQWKVETFDLCLSIQRILSAMTATIHEHNHKVTFSQEDNEIPHLTADRERIEQVVINLISNAIKYTPDGGRISVVVTSAAGTITLQVIDNGIGIPKEDLSHIFERFYRVEKSRTSETGGTGLGLAIAKELIEAHQGTITLDSVYGKGTTVTVTLPVVCRPQ